MPLPESRPPQPPGAAPERAIPGPAGLPVLGSMLDLRRDSLGTFTAAQREHGDVVRLEAGPPGLRSVFHAVFAPDGVQQILASQAANFRKDHPLYEEVRQSFGNGLLTSQDADYLRQRRLVQPLFTKRRVDGYASAVTTEATGLADRWRSADGHTVDLVPEMNRLPYLTQALKESMRLYPPAPVISRRAVAATEIGGFRIPAGADVVVAPWVTHRHPDLWADPERFDPQRFAPEREAERHRYAWFPFGGGPRSCIGQHFSMLESVLALAVLLRTYELDAVDEEVPVSAGITLQATGPARVRLRPRAGAGE
ncbi:cytochrome P450 [Streptomyces tubercidicus]|uniref:Cytochrome P450 n=1 Tax=Streptomyces tubercidicus TaxID=47759 RepID=A0A640UYC0_9ACTN|nr:cytochrome P450 [Streptomyces tubercidicus]WAU15060.1 cytochrome P450 [Streptomyces tubercidicus]GFE40869.1 hypothetical protein Stube_55420 [Streptomyces tubercidicus]